MSEYQYPSSPANLPLPLVEPGLRGALDAVRETATERPLLAIQVLGTVAATSAGVAALERYVDVDAPIAALAIGMVVALLIVNVMPAMWSTLLDKPISSEAHKAAQTKLGQEAIGAGGSAIFWAGVGLGPLFLLLIFGSELTRPVFVGGFILAALFAIRFVMAALVVVPMAVTEEDESSTLIIRSWRLSKLASGPLASIVIFLGVVAAITIAFAILAIDQLGAPLWVEEFVVLPAVNGVHTGLAALMSPAAYAIARHCKEGYGADAAMADLDDLLAPEEEEQKAR